MDAELFHRLKTIDNFISDINKQLDYTKYLTPINLSQENKKFLDIFEDGKEYNPKYFYQPYTSIDFEGFKKEVSQFNLSSSPIENIFSKYLLFLDNVISFYQNRENSTNFTKYSIRAFGFPEKRLVESAYSILATNQAEANEEVKQYSAHDLSVRLQEQLKQYNFKWKLTVLDSSTTKVTVDSEEQLIYLNGRIKFSERDIERLKVHEIDTHVVRAENGRIQPFKIFSTGLANSLSTEEGIAVVSEEMNNLLTKNTLRLYAGRVIAVSLSIEHSFYEIFKELLNYFNEQDALYITQRVKKGLHCTSEYGGFTKDYVYLDGYYKVKRFLDINNKTKFLFVGSIGLEDIKDIEQLLKTGVIKEPKIIPVTYNQRGGKC
jgi:uncharacterized protein (TIGR02421 family)